MLPINLAGRSDPTRRVRAAGLLSMLLLLPARPGALAQSFARQRSYFPPACAVLDAAMRTVGDGPEDEMRFDTARIQQALSACPAGEAVELRVEGSVGQPAEQRLDAFLASPLEIPPGVTLLIDAGVTIFASRLASDYRSAAADPASPLPCGDLACRALITAAGEAPHLGSGGAGAASVAGFGTLDARASQPLLDGGGSFGSWPQWAPAQRPHLIDATGYFKLSRINLRGGASTALHLAGSGAADIANATLLAAPGIGGMVGVEIASDRMRVTLTETQLAQSDVALLAPGGVNPAQISFARVAVHAGEAFSWSSEAQSAPTSEGGGAGTGARICIASSLPEPVCTAAALPLYSGAIFLSDAHATNMAESTQTAGLRVNAVAAVAEAGLPAAAGEVTFFDGNDALGKAEMVGGMATLLLPALDPQREHVLSARGEVPGLSFGSATALVQVSVTSLALAADTTSASYGTPVDLTASAMPATASGQVSFYDGSVLLGQAGLTSGSATWTETQLTPGMHSLTAHYAGDSLDSAADSAPLSLRIVQAQPVLRWSGVPSSAVYGALNQLNINITPSAAAGSVSVADSFTANGRTQVLQLGTVSLTSGSALFSLPALSAGGHVFTASYGGDSNDLAATSAPAAVTITRQDTAVTLSSTTAAPVYGSPAIFTATVSPVGATGSISFRDASAGMIGQASLVNGAAAVSVTSLAPGAHSISAAYTGDAADTDSVSPSISVQVARAPSTVTLQPIPAAVAAGSTLNLTTVLSPRMASGSVLFLTSVGTVLGQAQVVSGQAALSVPAPAQGSLTVTASYSGDSFYNPSDSAPRTTQVVATGSGVTLTVTPSPAPYGSAVTLAASVTPASATGAVTFSDALLGSLGTVPLTGGAGVLRLSSLPAGTHALQASYAGDSSDPGAVSPPVVLTVTRLPTVTTLALAQGTIPAGANVVFNVQVSALPGATPGSGPSGPVQIVSGSRVLASGSLQGGSPGAAYVTFSVPSATLGVGSFPVVAVYGGDNNDAGSSSVAGTVFTIVGMASSTTLAISSNQVPLGTPVGLSVHVSAADSALVPTGTVSFLDNGRVFGSAQVDAAGNAAGTLSRPGLGSHGLTAVYVATGLFLGSSAALAPLNVTLPIALALTPPALDAMPDSTHTAALTITPLSGFSGPIQATCSSQASFLRCTVEAPAQVGGAASPATVQIKVAHDLSGLAALTPSASSEHGLVLAALLPLWLLGRRRAGGGLRMLGCAALALLLSLPLGGCGLGGNFFDIPAGPQPVTVTVTAAGTPVSAAMTVNIVR